MGSQLESTNPFSESLICKTHLKNKRNIPTLTIENKITFIVTKLIEIFDRENITSIKTKIIKDNAI